MIIDNNRECTSAHTLHFLSPKSEQVLEHIFIKISIHFVVSMDHSITKKPINIVDILFFASFFDDKGLYNLYNVMGAVIREFITAVAIENADYLGR